ncbi:elongation factor P--(R)-beta-lysine ligase [Thalassotalea euphylliae]|uniref:Elongation factor P--(R)-beta-lysine ligase n=1 Tax=Thalassotalea euphylliae TaxID=1655234 RepID=A0A3E0UBQ1_9GAMM|nr:elongation factor P--(R)-beta-lysine ligase [Thalassotalea euphylliae]REL34023.1 elongation factor P--(R)-beta-lysine ligase [Thalassotalea euphylliae]
MSWQPSMNWETAQQRAKLLSAIRTFFNKRNVVEVETPQMCSGTITDVHLDPIPTSYDWHQDGACQLYLQTSPEYPMKRLLASGYQSIYQIAKAFRNEAEGRLHNPEFTMLEWYRVGFSMEELMNEVSELLMEVLAVKETEVCSYEQVFLTYTPINPLDTSRADCLSFINRQGKLEPWLEQTTSVDTLLQFIFCEWIEPRIGQKVPCFVHSFPSGQASLATINNADTRVANRFECYFKGIELVNGFHELTDQAQQLQRFEEDNQQRELMGLESRAIDQKFISALSHGLPACSGVALGIDRLMMLALERESIKEVITFTTHNA